MSERYTIEQHGDGYALYVGRDESHHGYNLAHITEADTPTLNKIERALNEMVAKNASETSEVRDRYIERNGAVIDTHGHSDDEFHELLPMTKVIYRLNLAEKAIVKAMKHEQEESLPPLRSGTIDVAAANANLLCVSVGDLRRWTYDSLLAFNLVCGRLLDAQAENERQRETRERHTIQDHIRQAADDLRSIASALLAIRHDKNSQKVVEAIIAVKQIDELEGFEWAHFPPVIETEDDGYKSFGAAKGKP